jgi:hypothetical protein
MTSIYVWLSRRLRTQNIFYSPETVTLLAPKSTNVFPYLLLLTNYQNDLLFKGDVSRDYNWLKLFISVHDLVGLKNIDDI